LRDLIWKIPTHTHTHTDKQTEVYHEYFKYDRIPQGTSPSHSIFPEDQYIFRERTNKNIQKSFSLGSGLEEGNKEASLPELVWNAASCNITRWRQLQAEDRCCVQWLTPALLVGVAVRTSQISVLLFGRGRERAPPPSSSSSSSSSLPDGGKASV
jgi:hypothetical protein